jgi:hypothetical protein
MYTMSKELSEINVALSADREFEKGSLGVAGSLNQQKDSCSGETGGDGEKI